MITSATILLSIYIYKNNESLINLVLRIGRHCRTRSRNLDLKLEKHFPQSTLHGRYNIHRIYK